MRTWELAVLLVAIGVAACSDASEVPTEVTSPFVERTLRPDSTLHSLPMIELHQAPANAPPEFQVGTYIDVQADVGFNGPSSAYGQANVRFYANNGTAQIDLVARNRSGSVVASNVGKAQKSELFPWSYSLVASTNVSLPESCGISVQGTATGTAHHSWISPVASIATWGQVTDDDTRNAAQASCPPDPRFPSCPVVRAQLAPSFDCETAPAPPPVAPTPTFCLDYAANNYGDYGICYYQPAGSAGGGYGTDYSVPVSTPSPGAPYSPPLYRVCDVWQPVTYYYDGDGNLNVEYGAREESCYFTY